MMNRLFGKKKEISDKTKGESPKKGKVSSARARNRAISSGYAVNVVGAINEGAYDSNESSCHKHLDSDFSSNDGGGVGCD